MRRHRLRIGLDFESDSKSVLTTDEENREDRDDDDDEEDGGKERKQEDEPASALGENTGINRTKEELQKLIVKDLKQLLKGMEMTMLGRKADLIQ